MRIRLLSRRHFDNRHFDNARLRQSGADALVRARPPGRAPTLILLCATALLLAGCSRRNNLLLGRVESPVGTHTVVVTDCYRTSVPGPKRVGATAYHYMPCRDADVWIREEELTVNGKNYGRLNPGDGVLVDHGVVSIERKQAR